MGGIGGNPTGKQLFPMASFLFLKDLFKNKNPLPSTQTHKFRPFRWLWLEVSAEAGNVIHCVRSCLCTWSTWLDDSA